MNDRRDSVLIPLSFAAAIFIVAIAMLMVSINVFTFPLSLVSADFIVSSRRLTPESTDVITQAVLHITRPVKPLLYQLLDSLLRAWPHNRGNTHIPLRCDFEVRRQTGHVGEALGLADRPFVE